MMCNHCNKSMKNAWIQFTDHKNNDINLCSYLCHTYSDYHYMWEDVKNKEDFNTLYPIVNNKQKTNFTILSKREIQLLNNTELDNYYDRLQDFKEFETNRYNMIKDIIEDTNYIDDYEDLIINYNDNLYSYDSE